MESILILLIIYFLLTKINCFVKIIFVRRIKLNHLGH